MLRIVRALEAPNQFERWRRRPEFAAIDNHPHFGAFSRQYYPLVFGDERQDESFAVLKCDGPELIVLCTIGAGNVDYYGQPIAFFGQATSRTEESPEIAAALDQLAILAPGNARISIRDETKNGATSALGTLCADRGYVPTRRSNGLRVLSLGRA